jgi:hypothetical protein
MFDRKNSNMAKSKNINKAEQAGLKYYGRIYV